MDKVDMWEPSLGQSPNPKRRGERLRFLTLLSPQEWEWFYVSCEDFDRCLLTLCIFVLADFTSFDFVVCLRIGALLFFCMLYFLLFFCFITSMGL